MQTKCRTQLGTSCAAKTSKLFRQKRLFSQRKTCHSPVCAAAARSSLRLNPTVWLLANRKKDGANKYSLIFIYVYVVIHVFVTVEQQLFRRVKDGYSALKQIAWGHCKTIHVLVVVCVFVSVFVFFSRAFI